MEEKDYKIDINNTRKGCLGGSDANILAQIANLGYVPRSAYKRMAVVNGLMENENVTTRVMLYGDFIEQSIYKNLAAENAYWQSNPLWISEKYSKGKVKLITHPDFVLYDEENKVLKIYECKATRFTPKQTKETYRNQMFIEWLIGNEIVKARGKDWKVQLFLCHYDTSDVNIEDEFSFDPSKLSIHPMRISATTFDIAKAMEITEDFLEDFNEYYGDGEEVDSEYMPEKVKKEFDIITSVLAEIKERKAKVDEFKKRLCEFMQEKGIKSIKNDAWNITLVAATESVSFDSKKFLADYTAKHPKKAKKLKKDYEKRMANGAYVTIKLKDKTKD